MKKEKEFLKNEYSELLDFVLGLQEDALKRNEELMEQKKELEFKKRQQEFLVEEQEKNRTPNISMFSPLSTDESDEEENREQAVLEQLQLQLGLLEEEWEKQKQVCSSFERLKQFFLHLDAKGQKRSKDQEEKSNLTSYSAKLIETQEMDRNRISRDLHDSTVQGLTTLVHKTEFCSKMLDRDPVRVRLELQSMIELNKEIINDMREIIYDLRPMSLNNIGLVSTVESFCLHLRRNDTVSVLLSIRGEEKPLTSIVNITLYRIIQEACNNALHHGHANKILVQITYGEDFMELMIEDDGVGFDLIQMMETSKKDELRGFGLSTMKERAGLLGGTFSIDTAPGKGTKINVVVPVEYTTEGNGE